MNEIYAEIVKLASMCEFINSKDFCEDDKIRAVNQRLLMKLVLHTSDSIAQRKLMEVPDLDLDLPAAVRILETYNSLQKTTNALTENDYLFKNTFVNISASGRQVLLFYTFD